MMQALLNQLPEKALFIVNNLHFVRADWFYAFIPLLLFLLFSYNKKSSDKNWSGVIDQQLLPFVLSKNKTRQRRYPLFLIFIAASLCITALAGPVYKQLPQPVYREQSSLVVLLDLSQSMNATDMKPSRLERAKLELLDILKTRKTGQTAFIVYAADAFVVTPLTDDNATIANLVPSLDTAMMPAQGSDLSNALAKAYALFTQSGVINGNILVMTDDIHQRDVAAIEKIAAQGHRVSIFGIGTDAGSPIPLDGGFLQDKNGAIVIAKLPTAQLQKDALLGGGLYTSVQADDSDVDKLTRLFQSSQIKQPTAADNTNVNADVWQEEGYWLVLPLLFFAALWARKGWLAIALIFILPFPQPSYADNVLLDSEHLWLSSDQKGMKAFDAGDNAAAAENFTRPEWKASAYYRNGDFAAAAKALEQTADTDGFYNKANALAKLGKYQEAVAAYDKAIELDEHNEDAKYNREQIKQALKKQDSDKNDSKKEQSQQDKSEQDDKQQDSEKKDSQKQNSQQQSENKDSEQQKQETSTEKTDEKKPGEDKANEKKTESEKNNDDNKSEEEQLKQRDAKKEKQQQQKQQQQYEQDQKKQQEEQDKKQGQEENKEQKSDEIENKDSDEEPAEIEINPVEASITEQEKATEQWLKRIPDDPGGLLKRKFLYQYNQLPNQHDDNEPW